MEQLTPTHILWQDRDMTTTAAPEFAPLTLNGEAIATWRTATEVVIDGRLYFAEFAASDDCSCRRCTLHEDFGGCIVADAQWGLVQFLLGGVR